MSTLPDLRIGDAERDGAATALGEHYVAGRLTKEEFDERSARIWSARIQADLEPIFADLPSPRAPVGAGSRVSPSQRSPERGWRRPGPLTRLVPLLAFALIAVVIISGMPWLLFMLFWFWALGGPARWHSRRWHHHQPATGMSQPWRR
jgi:hypothetical protein